MPSLCSVVVGHMLSESTGSGKPPWRGEGITAIVSGVY